MRTVSSPRPTHPAGFFPRVPIPSDGPEQLVHLIAKIWRDFPDPAAWPEKLWQALPASWRESLPRAEWDKFLSQFNATDPAAPPRLDAQGALLESRDAADPRALLKVLPFRAKAALSRLGGEVGGEICLATLEIPLDERTSLEAKGLCAAAKAGAGLVFAPDAPGNPSLPGFVFGRTASFAEIKMTREIPGDDGCKRALTGRFGVGSLGSAAEVTPENAQIYHGAGWIGLGAGIQKSCPSQEKR